MESGPRVEGYMLKLRARKHHCYTLRWYFGLAPIIAIALLSAACAGATPALDGPVREPVSADEAREIEITLRDAWEPFVVQGDSVELVTLFPEWQERDPNFEALKPIFYPSVVLDEAFWVSRTMVVAIAYDVTGRVCPDNGRSFERHTVMLALTSGEWVIKTIKAEPC